MSRRRRLGDEHPTFLIEDVQDKRQFEEEIERTDEDAIGDDDDDPIKDPTFRPEGGSVQFWQLEEEEEWN